MNNILYKFLPYMSYKKEKTINELVLLPVDFCFIMI